MSALPSEKPAIRASRLPSPAFLVILAAFAGSGWYAWQAGTSIEPSTRLALFFFVVTGWLVSLCLHEYGHAVLAYRAGDHSVAEKGYLSLNPMRYSDAALSFVIPVVFVLLGGIGLPGGAVYIDRSKISGRLRHSLISAAGPLVNLVFAVGLAVLVGNLISGRHGPFWFGVSFLALLQLTAALLNLLPVPGLDGFGIIAPYLPPRWTAKAAQIAPYGFLALIAVLWIPPVNQAFFNGIYSLLDLLGVRPGYAVAGDNLFRFWTNVS
ncbi:site-2 protease family protein [Bailinhaonella thermotolerans]|uniref:Site-2 protease family protein n=1 Tax=Bailinhaonella thermotolerans TaxID=1070861 RepID=A0A3A4B514_9ACTN|nr:site-2 protease family protein [Bailinhaonella thermotolerans]RJL33427.1 site-2 protease family protein [Bailinhaonella thermotolerans]